MGAVDGFHGDGAGVGEAGGGGKGAGAAGVGALDQQGLHASGIAEGDAVDRPIAVQRYCIGPGNVNANVIRRDWRRTARPFCSIGPCAILGGQPRIATYERRGNPVSWG